MSMRTAIVFFMVLSNASLKSNAFPFIYGSWLVLSLMFIPAIGENPKEI